jgi:2-polyprenyl-6-methoxyphenol hydroxylase-like FAD-dependent oxidoreductase
MRNTEASVRCCIAGGGPAGMMLGFLLARAGISVLVLEEHGDFCAISVAIRSIPRASKSCTSWVS